MVVVVVVAGMVMRGVVVRTRRAVHMLVVARMAVIVVMTGLAMRGVSVPMIVDMAVRALAGRRRRVGNGRRLRVARLGAARVGAAGMTVSWVVGTLGVGHDNLLCGLTV
ncbi:hypothetical protein [Burkholderia cenocepacia]|uniref:hypothetical protein n=1 Tax=Burkholderia cenocepacia TaxID=95486 RepID=UPI0027422DFE|nr:hypothetical protein [Burkholderia cenocepacia]